MHKASHILIVGLAMLMFVSCSKDIEDTPAVNQLPKTFLWLHPDSTVAVGVSRQRIRWWGEDPDGVVRGYLFAFNVTSGEVTTLPNPDTLTYSWVTANDTLILFPLDTVFRKFTIYVRSVDNTFGGLPERSSVKFSPNPYWDKNGNGVFDTGDEPLTTLVGGTDSKGAVQTFPVRNTRPQIAFLGSPTDPVGGARQPDTTYTVATFSWKATDDDGESNLASYRIALNDTSSESNWVTLALRDTLVTLVVRREVSDSMHATDFADLYTGTFLGGRLIGRIPGIRYDTLNRLFIQAKDVAGEYSAAATLPSGANKWYVKRPSARISPQAKTVLVVSDYVNSDSSQALATYRLSLAGLFGVNISQIDWLNLGLGIDPTSKSQGRTGPMVPPFVDPALIRTFLLYDYVVWYTDQYPSLGVAQLSLFTYNQNGGKVIFSTTFQSSVDARGALRDFAPIDSISSVPFLPRPAPGDTRVPVNYRVIPDSSVPSAVYPQLAFDSVAAGGGQFHTVFMRPVYRRSDARYIYHLQRDSLNLPNPRYIGEPNVAVVDGQRRILFIGLPLHLLDKSPNSSGLTAFFTRAITQEFDRMHNIDRRKF